MPKSLGPALATSVDALELKVEEKNSWTTIGFISYLAIKSLDASWIFRLNLSSNKEGSCNLSEKIDNHLTFLNEEYKFFCYFVWFLWVSQILIVQLNMKRNGSDIVYGRTENEVQMYLQL